MTELSQLLRRHQAQFGPVLPIDLNSPEVCRLDFTACNPRVVGIACRAALFSVAGGAGHGALGHRVFDPGRSGLTSGRARQRQAQGRQG